MSFLFAFGLYVVFLAGYWFFVVSVIWHLKEYTLPEDYSGKLIKWFIGMIIFLNLISLFFLFKLPL